MWDDKITMFIVLLIALVLLIFYIGLFIYIYNRNKNIVKEISQHRRIIFKMGHEWCCMEYSYYYVNSKDNYLQNVFKVWRPEGSGTVVQKLKFSEYNITWKFADAHTLYSSYK